jgi:hypothetical protein
LRPSLRARRANLDIGLEPPAGLLALAGERGFAWRSPDRTLVTAGVAARIPVAPGAGRLERLAATVAGLLAPATTADGGPLAVGALPFDDSAPGELTVPALVVEPAPGGGGAGAPPPPPPGLPARPHPGSRARPHPGSRARLGRPRGSPPAGSGPAGARR